MQKVAIVGRPNVGKSTLFNRITGRRHAIVEDIPAVTRDRLVRQAEWLGCTFELVDTGGIIFKENDSISIRVRKQAEKAVEESDVIIFCIDSKAGILPLDEEIALFLKKSGKPVLLAANKSDSPMEDEHFSDFYRLGLGKPFMISSMHGRAVDELLDGMLEYFPEKQNTVKDENIKKIAIVGRPNVGKSTLFNIFAGEERSIVHNEAGTTRDAIDITVNVNKRKYTIVDTAGIRKKSKISDKVEQYSVHRALQAIEHADISVFLVEPEELFTHQDMKLVGYIKKNYKPCVVVVNKWDTVEKETNTMKKYEDEVREKLDFASYVPVIFMSAINKRRIHTLFEKIELITKNLEITIQTAELNSIFHDALSSKAPPFRGKRPFKFYYVTQTSSSPVTFTFFCNTDDSPHFSYLRYLENHFRRLYPFEGVPLKFVFKRK